LTKAAKDSSSRLVAGFCRNFPQDSRVILIVGGGKATFIDSGGLNPSLASRTLNVAENEIYLIEILLSYKVTLVGQMLVSSIGNVG